MRLFDILIEGRRLQTALGRFLLNPSKAEFDGYFRGSPGAAFYLDQTGDVALGASTNGLSIDHSTTAEAFGLNKEAEAARGYITSEGSGQIEVWAKDTEAGEAITDSDKMRIAASISAVKSNPSLSRLASTWRLLVFNSDYVEILEKTL